MRAQTYAREVRIGLRSMRDARTYALRSQRAARNAQHAMRARRAAIDSARAHARGVSSFRVL